MEGVREGIRIFKNLMLNGEISRKDNHDLYTDYLENNVREVLTICEEEFEAKIINFNDTLYLVPEIDGNILGINPSDLKMYFGSKATKRDVYLGYYIIMYIFYEFYNGKNRDPKTKEFLQISYLLNALDQRFENLEKKAKEEIEDMEEIYKINIQSSIGLWNALMADHESKQKTKYNIVRNVCRILEDQKLAFVVDEQIRTRPKLDILMSQYFLNSDRLSQINSAFEKGEL